MRTIIRWSGDNPARVTRALEESFIGYAQDPTATLQKSFDEIEGYDHCMTARGVRKPDTDLVTSRMLGCFRDNPQLRQEFLGMTA